MKTNEMIAALRNEGTPLSEVVADRLEEMLIANKALETRLAQARADRKFYREEYERFDYAIRNLYYNITQRN